MVSYTVNKDNSHHISPVNSHLSSVIYIICCSDCEFLNILFNCFFICHHSFFHYLLSAFSCPRTNAAAQQQRHQTHSDNISNSFHQIHPLLQKLIDNKPQFENVNIKTV